ncbi:unnamed protein product [Lampetra fluviatilis]
MRLPVLALALTLTLCPAAAYPLLLPRQRLLERERQAVVDSEPGLSSESDAFPDEAFLAAATAEQPGRRLGEVLGPRSSLAEVLGPRRGLSQIIASQGGLEEALGGRLGLGKDSVPVELWRSLLLAEPWRGGAVGNDAWAADIPPVAFNPDVAPSHRPASGSTACDAAEATRIHRDDARTASHDHACRP